MTEHRSNRFLYHLIAVGANELLYRRVLKLLWKKKKSLLLVNGRSQKNRFNSYAHNRFILPLEAVAEGQLLYLLAYSLVHTSSNANLT